MDSTINLKTEINGLSQNIESITEQVKSLKDYANLLNQLIEFIEKEMNNESIN